MTDVRTIHAIADDDLLRDAEGHVLCEFCGEVMEAWSPIEGATLSGAAVQSSVFYTAYAKWCKSQGFVPRNARQLKREMLALGFVHRKGMYFNEYVGIDLQVQANNP